jgi:3-phenylpropionate/trans-cinnamate dioxygenase ferredoxin reductase component
MLKTIVIIGGGIAGVCAAEEIRAKDAACEVIIIERENNPLYSRVLLPHYVKGVIPREKVFLKTEAWYAEKRITYLSGIEAEEISAKHQFVRISGNREIPYDELVIATGTHPRLLLEDAKGVHYLYTLADADGVRTHLDRSPSSEQTLVYGGGFISCEFINALVRAGKKPTLLLKGKGFWSKVLLPEGQQVLRDVLAQQNIEVHENVGDIEIQIENDALCGVKDEHGKEYQGTFLGVGIGAELETHLAREARIEVAEGIIANEGLLTSAEHVYTAGDVAQAPDTHTGRSRIHGNWAHAQQEGRRVGKACIGEFSPTPPPSQYSTDLLGCKIAFIGDVQKEAADEVRIIATQTGYTQIFLRKNVLVGVALLGNMTDRMHFTGMLGKTWE